MGLVVLKSNFIIILCLIQRNGLSKMCVPKPTPEASYNKVLISIAVYGEYDYIIVGAGSAGSVIANRLSEITENGVLLLEAGGYESDFSDIPGMDIYLQGLEFNWNYNSTPQTTSCLG